MSFPIFFSINPGGLSKKSPNLSKPNLSKSKPVKAGTTKAERKTAINNLNKGSGKFDKPENLKRLQEFGLNALKTVSKLKYGNVWLDIINSAVNSITDGAATSVLSHYNYTSSNIEKYYTKTEVAMGGRYTQKISKYRGGPTYETVNRELFNTRLDAMSKEARRDLKSTAGCQQKNFTFLDTSTFLDVKKVSTICQIEENLPDIKDYFSQGFELAADIASKNLKLKTLKNANSTETLFSLDLTQDLINNKIKKIQNTRRKEYFSALIGSKQKLSIFNILPYYNATIKIHLIQLNDDIDSIESLLKLMVGYNNEQEFAKSIEDYKAIKYNRSENIFRVNEVINDLDLVKIKLSNQSEELRFSNQLVTDINANVLQLKSFKENCKIIRTWKKEIPSGGQWDFNFKEVFTEGINLSNLAKLRHKYGSFSNYDAHPLSYSILIESHGDFRCSVTRTEDSEKFSGISSPVHLSFEHKLEVKQLASIDEQDAAILFYKQEKINHFEDESLGLEIYPNRNPSFRIDFENIKIDHKSKKNSTAEYVLSPYSSQDEKEIGILSDFVETLKSLDSENKNYYTEEDNTDFQPFDEDSDESFEEDSE